MARGPLASGRFNGDEASRAGFVCTSGRVDGEARGPRHRWVVSWRVMRLSVRGGGGRFLFFALEIQRPSFLFTPPPPPNRNMLASHRSCLLFIYTREKFGSRR